MLTGRICACPEGAYLQIVYDRHYRTTGVNCLSQPIAFDKDNLAFELAYGYEGQQIVQREVVTAKVCLDRGWHVTQDRRRCVQRCAEHEALTDENVCQCSFLAADGSTCLEACWANQVGVALPASQEFTMCVCETNYTISDDQRSCACTLFGADGETCVRQCGPYARAVPLQDEGAYACRCLSGFRLAEDGWSCVCDRVLSADGERCVSECSGKVLADGTCENTSGSGSTVAVAVLACVAALAVVVAVVLFCRARAAKKGQKVQ